jgi:hypothetical protein
MSELVEMLVAIATKKLAGAGTNAIELRATTDRSARRLTTTKGPGAAGIKAKPATVGAGDATSALKLNLASGSSKSGPVLPRAPSVNSKGGVRSAIANIFSSDEAFPPPHSIPHDVAPGDFNDGSPERPDSRSPEGGNDVGGEADASVDEGSEGMQLATPVVAIKLPMTTAIATTTGTPTTQFGVDAVSAAPMAVTLPAGMDSWPRTRALPLPQPAPAPTPDPVPPEGTIFALQPRSRQGVPVREVATHVLGVVPARLVKGTYSLTLQWAHRSALSTVHLDAVCCVGADGKLPPLALKMVDAAVLTRAATGDPHVKAWWKGERSRRSNTPIDIPSSLSSPPAQSSQPSKTSETSSSTSSSMRTPSHSSSSQSSLLPQSSPPTGNFAHEANLWFRLTHEYNARSSASKLGTPTRAVHKRRKLETPTRAVHKRQKT